MLFFRIKCADHVHSARALDGCISVEKISLLPFYLNSFIIKFENLPTHYLPNNTISGLYTASRGFKSPLALNFLKLYYTRTDNTWLDGYLLDFLQKKTVDFWLRNYVIFTGFLFSERLVFDTVIRLYINYFIQILQAYNIFETTNVASILNTIIYLYFTLLAIVTLLLYSTL